MVNKKKKETTKTTNTENKWGEFAVECFYNFLITIVYGLLGSSFVYYILLRHTKKDNKKPYDYNKNELNKFFNTNKNDYYCLVDDDVDKCIKGKEVEAAAEASTTEAQNKNEKLSDVWPYSSYNRILKDGDEEYDAIHPGSKSESKNKFLSKEWDITKYITGVNYIKKQSWGDWFLSFFIGDVDVVSGDVTLVGGASDDSTEDECDDDVEVKKAEIKKPLDLYEYFFISRWVIYIKNLYANAIALTFFKNRKFFHDLHGFFSPKENCGIRGNPYFQMFLGPIIYIIIIALVFITGFISFLMYLLYVIFSTNYLLIIAFVFTIFIIMPLATYIGLYQLLESIYKFVLSPLLFSQNDEIKKNLFKHKEFLSIIFCTLSLISAFNTLTLEISIPMAVTFFLILAYRFMKYYFF